jgi:hypothetical protein
MRKKDANTSEAFAAATDIAARAARDIGRRHGEGLSREECLKLVCSVGVDVSERP